MNNSKFYSILPLILIYDQQYKSLSANAIILYSLILNRMKLSWSNKEYQDNMGTFIHYSASQISEHLRCGKSTTRNVLRELETVGLIKVICNKNGLPLKIYVNDIFGVNKSTYNKNIPQDKPTQKKNYNYKSPAVHKETSFDINQTAEMANNHLMHFAEKKKKRQTENNSPTI